MTDMKWINDLWAWLLGEERAVIAELRADLAVSQRRIGVWAKRVAELEHVAIADMRADIDAIKAKIATL